MKIMQKLSKEQLKNFLYFRNPSVIVDSECDYCGTPFVEEWDESISNVIVGNRTCDDCVDCKSEDEEEDNED